MKDARCNRLECPPPPPRLDCPASNAMLFMIGHDNDHGINLHGVPMILMGNLLAGGHSVRGTLGPGLSVPVHRGPPRDPSASS